MSRFSWQSNDETGNSNNLNHDKRFSWQKAEKTDLNSDTDIVQTPSSKQPKSMKSAWRILSGQQQGTSHVTNNTPCEDFYCIDVNDKHLFIFVADGAGSAKCGGEGAKLACQSAMAFVIETFATTQTVTDHLAHQLIIHIQNEINQHIQNKDEILTLKDFACTFLGVLVVNGQTLLIQVGDGAIVVNFDDIDNHTRRKKEKRYNHQTDTQKDNKQTNQADTGLIVPIKPMQGEYANMTHFVTSSHATKYLVSKTYQKIPSQIVVMTDGLQRLALNMADFTPHVPFFAPFFQALISTENNATGKQALQTALDTFLDSQAVNARTDDDKTLVIAQNLLI